MFFYSQLIFLLHVSVTGGIPFFKEENNSTQQINLIFHTEIQLIWQKKCKGDTSDLLTIHACFLRLEITGGLLLGIYPNEIIKYEKR